MKQFDIQPVDRSIQQDAINKIDNLTKPKGSLGRLEELALRLCMIQHTLSPQLHQPHNVLFAVKKFLPPQSGLNVYFTSTPGI